MPAKLTIEHAHNLAESQGFKFLSSEFNGTKRKHLWVCGQEHEWMVTYTDIKQGNGCPLCLNLKKTFTIQDAHNLAESTGIKFLSPVFENTSTKHLWGCTQGHEWMARYHHIKQGRGCPHCANLKKTHTIQDAHNLAESRGLKFLSPVFKNAITKHLWACGQEHEWMVTYAEVKQGNGCPHCANLKKRHTIQDAHNLAESQGIKFLSPVFENTSTKHLWGCTQGHEWMTTYNTIQQGHGCPHCADKTRGEKLTRYCFEQMLIADFAKIRPAWLLNPETGRRLELDGYNEQMKIAFEHQGIHHEVDCPKDNIYYKSDQFFKDEIKRQVCKEQGIVLIEVPEIGRRLKVKDVVAFLFSEFDKHNIAYPESAKNFKIDMKEFYAEYVD